MSLSADEKFLLELTSLPTAAGREEAVVERLRAWAAARPLLELRRDPCGNIRIARKDFDGACAKKRPLFITAHLDHPAFVLRSVKGSVAELEFRGGVLDAYFKGAAIEIFDPALERGFPAVITALYPKAKPFKRVKAALRSTAASAALKPGCIGRWKFPGAAISGGLARTHACDDLAGAAAALAAYDAIHRKAGLAHTALLFTRAEEIGFVGAIGAARGGSVPAGARLVCLECSRSFPHDSPIGAGPIVRVGDKMSVFTPELTNAVAAIAAAYQLEKPAFRFQRKLMAGGTCEASAFSAYGLASTCLCLPLGNYHNMADIDGVSAGKERGRVGREYVSTADFRGLVELLGVIAARLDAPAPARRAVMERIWAEHGGLLAKK
jgi:endoglucanase